MNEPDTSNLLSEFLDGELSEEQLDAFATRLQENPELIESVRRELEFIDLIEQSTAPERSFQAFINGLETRVHAEETAGEFIAELLPKLKAIDEREADRKIVPFPFPLPFARRSWAGVAAAAAAVAALIAIPAVLINRDGGNLQAVQAVATMGKISEDAVWERTSESIEWADGSQVMAGTPVRLRAGTVRLNFENGNTVTIEGPADLRIMSSSEGFLREGKVLAQVSPENDPFVIHAPNLEVSVDGATAGVSVSEGNHVEASQLSQNGAASTRQSDGMLSRIRPGETVIASPSMAGLASVPFDHRPFHNHLPLLSGVESYSSPVQFGIPGAPARTSADDASDQPGAIHVVLESDRLRLRERLEVDLVPGSEVANHDKPAIENRKQVRSYLVQLGTTQRQQPVGADGFVEASITFDRPILGVSTTADTLDDSDSLTGHEEGTMTLASLGLADRGLQTGDRVQITGDGGRTLDLHMKLGARTSLGQLRVFVASN